MEDTSKTSRHPGLACYVAFLAIAIIVHVAASIALFVSEMDAGNCGPVALGTYAVVVVAVFLVIGSNFREALSEWQTGTQSR